MDIVEYKGGNSLELANKMWFQRARWVLKAIFTSGVGLKFAYINGLAYNQAFINEFGLKSFLFSFADSELYVSAYMAAMYGLSGWVEFVLGSFLPLLTICGTVSLVWFAPHICDSSKCLYDGLACISRQQSDVFGLRRLLTS